MAMMMRFMLELTSDLNACGDRLPMPQPQGSAWLLAAAHKLQTRCEQFLLTHTLGPRDDAD